MTPLSNALRRAQPRHLQVQLALVLCAIVTSSGATTAIPTSNYSRCIETFKNDVVQMGQCAELELKRQKTQLRPLYQKRLDDLAHNYGRDHPSITSLKEAQKWWEKYQAADCQSHIGSGGAWGGLEVLECQIGMYKERIRKLQAED